MRNGIVSPLDGFRSPFGPRRSSSSAAGPKVLLKADGTVFTTADGRVLVRSA